MPRMDADTANEVSKIQLTRTEFADALGLKPTSLFVRNMFLMVDKDRNGFVGFQEFLDMFLILAGGMQRHAFLFHLFFTSGLYLFTPHPTPISRPSSSTHTLTYILDRRQMVCKLYVRLLNISVCLLEIFTQTNI